MLAPELCDTISAINILLNNHILYYLTFVSMIWIKRVKVKNIFNANNRNSTDNGLINYIRNYPFHVTSDQDVVIHGEKLLKDVSHSHPGYFLTSSFDFFFFFF